LEKQPTGIFNAGTNVGAIIAPATALILSEYFGWQSAFLFTGAVGFIWLIFWWALYKRPEEHPRLSSEELQFIRDGEVKTEESKIPWLSLLGFRQTWAFVVGKSGLVVLFVLVAQIPQQKLRHQRNRVNSLSHGCLSDRRCWFGRRWIYVFRPDQARMDSK
jgi:MFS family permease